MDALWNYRSSVWDYRESTWTLDSDLVGYGVEASDGQIGSARRVDRLSARGILERPGSHRVLEQRCADK